LALNKRVNKRNHPQEDIFKYKANEDEDISSIKTVKSTDPTKFAAKLTVLMFSTNKTKQQPYQTSMLIRCSRGGLNRLNAEKSSDGIIKDTSPSANHAK
jgi:hypothetical protein